MNRYLTRAVLDKSQWIQKHHLDKMLNDKSEFLRSVALLHPMMSNRINARARLANKEYKE